MRVPAGLDVRVRGLLRARLAAGKGARAGGHRVSDKPDCKCGLHRGSTGWAAWARI